MSIFGSMTERHREKIALRDRAQGEQGPAPQIGGAQHMFNADRRAQGQALGMFGQAAAGNAPSLAQLQGQQMAQQAVTDQMGMLAQGRGGSMAATARAAQGMGAAGQMGAAQQAAQLRAQEIAQARDAYAQQANAMAAQTGGFMGQNADLAQQWGLAQRGMDLQALKDQREFGMGIADKIVGSGSALGSLAMFSDARLKTDIEPDEDAAADTLASLQQVRYRYKDEKHGPTDVETVGFLAQDLENTPAGKRVVREVPGEGKAIDGPGLLSLLTAHGAGVEQRLRKLEGRR